MGGLALYRVSLRSPECFAPLSQSTEWLGMLGAISNDSLSGFVLSDTGETAYFERERV